MMLAIPLSAKSIEWDLSSYGMGNLTSYHISFSGGVIPEKYETYTQYLDEGRVYYHNRKFVNCTIKEGETVRGSISNIVGELGQDALYFKACVAIGVRDPQSFNTIQTNAANYVALNEGDRSASASYTVGKGVKDLYVSIDLWEYYKGYPDPIPYPKCMFTINYKVEQNAVVDEDDEGATGDEDEDDEDEEEDDEEWLEEDNDAANWSGVDDFLIPGAIVLILGWRCNRCA